MIYRREVLQRDEPIDFKAALAEIRATTGLGTSGVAFVLNVPRGTLLGWETGSEPGFENGRAILKYLENCRSTVTSEAEIVA